MSADDKDVAQTEGAGPKPDPQAAGAAPQANGHGAAGVEGEGGAVVLEDAAMVDADVLPEDDETEILTEDQRRIRELEQVAASVRREAEEAQARLRAVSKAYTDLQAEMSSFRERQAARARDDTERQAFSLAKAFFDPVMNLKRSLQNVSKEAASDPVFDGLKMVHHQFMSALNNLGLEEVPGEGAPFDPNLHEALAVTPVLDPAQDGRVLAVHAAGYTVNGRVLQAAQVVVGKHQGVEGGEA